MKIFAALFLAAFLLAGPPRPAGPGNWTPETLRVRGRPQALHLYGRRGGNPVVVLSGDGGWVHLGPHVAEALSARGYFVVGFDVRSYLASFTTATAALTMQDVPADIGAVAARAFEGSPSRPVLVGVSEGAGLAVLTAADATVQKHVAGIVCLGLPEMNELAWRWTDAWIYLSHGVPHEPAFDTRPVIGRVAPVPLAAIYSSHDEFVPVTVGRALFDAALEPKRLWVVDAADHRFSNNLAQLDQRLVDAVDWVRSRATP